MSSSHEGRSVQQPKPDASETESVSQFADLPQVDAGEQAADVKGGVLKTRHDTVKNSIGN
jgi:hypothetical protein